MVRRSSGRPAFRPLGRPMLYHGTNLFSKLTVMRFHEVYINCVWWSCGLFGGLKKASRARHKYLAFLPFILFIVMIVVFFPPLLFYSYIRAFLSYENKKEPSNKIKYENLALQEQSLILPLIIFIYTRKTLGGSGFRMYIYLYISFILYFVLRVNGKASVRKVYMLNGFLIALSASPGGLLKRTTSLN